VTGRWFSLGIPVSSINKTDCHDIIEILLKVALKQKKTNKDYQTYWGGKPDRYDKLTGETLALGRCHET